MIKKINFIALILLMGFISKVCFAEDSKSKSILLSPFDVASPQKSKKTYKEFMPDLLTAYLAPYSDQIQVVERKNLNAILAEQGLKLERMLKDMSFHKIGQLTQAQYILQGSLTETNGRVLLQAFLYDTETTQLQKSYKHTGTWQSVPQMCQSLASDLGSTFSMSLKKISDLPTDKDPIINLHMITGLGFFYNGQFQKAMPEFLKIINKKPNHPEAKFFFARSLFEADMKGHAKIELKQFVKKFPNHPKAKDAKKLLTKIKTKE